MSIYDVDFKKAGPQLLPPDKRGPRMTAFLWVIMKPLQWVRDLWLGSYRTGTEAQPYIPGTYSKYDQVIYKQRVYESLSDGNIALPPDQAYWMMIQENFIGVSERVLYTGQKLTFEYGINKNFGTIFRNPPNESDIYVTVQAKPKDVFVVGASESNSSIVYSKNSEQFVINAYNFGTYFNMTIHVPQATYNALDPVPLNAERIIRNFADKYINAGIIYQIIPY